MQYRRFGKTDLNLSVFSLGTMRCLGSEENFYKTLETAISLGINHLETARGYGKSEQFLGNFLQQQKLVSREKIYITTKLTPTPDADKLSKCIDESLQRLQVDYIDCLAIHGINTWEHLEWTVGGFLPLERALNEDKIKHIGFSTHGSLDLILATIETGLFEFVNLHYYYFFQHNYPAISLASQKDMGIFIISPGDKGGLLYTPSSLLERLCAPFSPLELTYRFLLSDHRVTTLSTGASNPDDFQSIIPLFAQNGQLTLEEKKKFNQLEEHFNKVLDSDKCSQCYKCLPCPESINIPEILRLRNLTVAYDMKEYGQYRYGMLENAGHWFPGKKGNRCTDCGDCLPRCPENLEIPMLLKDTHERLKGNARRRLWE
ncbi:aldo/keto reductase [Crocosphaera sp. Alani8]|uniref:aldo/keto reductase n=1 Tax=Crocosphaera sp. Alani8 TaxID=3038952 RepID=UPI00313E27E4